MQGSGRDGVLKSSLVAHSNLGNNRTSLPKSRESTRKIQKSTNLRGGGPPTQSTRLQVFPDGEPVLPVMRVGEVPGSNPGAPIGTILPRRVSGVVSGWYSRRCCPPAADDPLIPVPQRRRQARDRAQHQRLAANAPLDLGLTTERAAEDSLGERRHRFRRAPP